jgi:hypothetical protein
MNLTLGSRKYAIIEAIQSLESTLASIRSNLSRFEENPAGKSA